MLRGIAGLAWLALVMSVPAWAQDDRPPTYYCIRATGPVVIDGRLDDFVWANARRVGEFIEQGDRNEAPTYHTEATLAWDDTYLYTAFASRDPDIWTMKTQRDSNLHQNENVEIFFGDAPVGAEIVDIWANGRAAKLKEA